MHNSNIRGTNRPARTAKWLATATVAAATATTIGLAAAPASAAGTALLASTTTISAVMAADGSGLALTSTVAQSGTSSGLGLPPSGTVTFTDDANDKLGSVAVPGCLLKVCTVQRTVKTSQFANKVTKITATYSGDSLLKPSAVTTTMLWQRCLVAAGCYGVLTNATTGVAVSLPVNDNALVTLGGAQLPCSAPGGSVVNIATSGTGKGITMQLQHAGAAAAAYVALDTKTKVAQSHTNYRCDVSTVAYQGFSPAAAYTKTTSDFANYGTTPKLTTGAYAGQYAGLIPDCSYWFAHSLAFAPVCNSVPANTPPAGNDVTFIVLNAASGVSHIAG